MKIIILISSILMFSCASSHYTSPIGDTSSVAIQDSMIDDLTAKIRKQPGVSVTGIGARAAVYMRKQNCKPLFFLNGSLIHDYRTLYNLVSTERIELVKVIQPRQAFIYGLRSASGVIEVTTKPDFLVFESD